MLKIEICVGSSCHLKGAHKVVMAFQNEVKNLGLEEGTDIQLKGSFCQGRCVEGVVVKVNDQIYTHVKPENAQDILKDNK